MQVYRADEAISILSERLLDKPAIKAFEIDPKQIDIERIHSVLESNSNSIVALYNYLIEKGTIKA